MKALIDAVGGERVGVKISPLHTWAGMVFDDPVATWNHLIDALNPLDFSFVELMKRSPVFPLPSHYPQQDEIELFGSRIRQPLIAGGGYSADSGEAELEKGIASLIAYGNLFLANPDLPRRFELKTTLTTPDRSTLFGGNDKGYIDYPALP